MSSSYSIAQALRQAQQQGIARLDAQLLLLTVLERDSTDRAWLLANDEQALSSQQQQLFNHYCQQRLQGMPVAYLVGEKEFFGLSFQVNSAVLIPRPDSETLVEWGLEILQRSNLAAPKVLDLGTGSGAIACAIKANFPRAEVWALDSSAAALQLASANAARLGLEINFLLSDWCSQLAPQLKFDLIVSNPPYIAANDEHLAALSYEPQSALVAAADGLADISQIARQSQAHLKPQAVLLFEHGHQQQSQVAAILQQHNFDNIQQRQDLAGISRCSGGQFTASSTN